MKAIDEAAARATVMDLAGGAHPLEELWADKTVVLVFLRHFG